MVDGLLSMFQFNQPRDRWVSWYAVDLPYKAHKDEKDSERRERRKRDWEILKAKGGWTPKALRWHYRDVDKKAEAKTKKKAEAMAEYVTKVTGIAVEVHNGSYL